MKKGRFVITGAPCTGKTTVINEFFRQGFYVIEEPSRRPLEENPKFRDGSASNEDVDRLQKIILKIQLKVEANLPKEETIFFDGGIPSCIAFYKIRGMAPPMELIDACKNTQYDRVFIMDRLSKYETDGIRLQTEGTSIKIHQLLYDAYFRFGYKPIRVPVLSPADRAEFIKNNL